MTAKPVLDRINVIQPRLGEEEAPALADGVAQGAKEKEFESPRRGIMAAHRQPASRWRDSGKGLLQHTERLNDRMLILPVYDSLDRIIGAIRAAAAGTRP